MYLQRSPPVAIAHLQFAVRIIGIQDPGQNHPKPSLNDVVTMTGLSDETLLQKLAGDNGELRKQLQGLLGSETFDPPAPSKPAPDPVSKVPPIAPASTTKH
jgi:hypothetical protein